MNTTGRAKGPGPHRTHVRETQKRGVVRQARRASRSAAFGLRPGTGAAGFIGKRRAVSSGQAQRIPAKVRPVSLGHFGRTCSHPPAPAAAGIAFLGPRTMAVRDARGHTRPRPVPPRPVPCATARILVRCARRRPQASKGRLPSMGTLSARASRGLARPGSRRRPRRSPRPWHASAHRGQCQAA